MSSPVAGWGSMLGPAAQDPRVNRLIQYAYIPGEFFGTVQKICNALDDEPMDERSRIAGLLLNSFERGSTALVDGVGYFTDWASENTQGLQPEAFPACVGLQDSFKRNRQTEAIKKIGRVWGAFRDELNGPVFDKAFEMANSSTTGAKAIVALANRYKRIDVAAERVNMAMIGRLKNPGRGVRPSQELQPIDVERGAKWEEGNMTDDLAAQIHRKAREDLDPKMFHLTGHFLYTAEAWGKLSDNVKRQRPSDLNQPPQIQQQQQGRAQTAPGSPAGRPIGSPRASPGSGSPQPSGNRQATPQSSPRPGSAQVVTTPSRQSQQGSPSTGGRTYGAGESGSPRPAASRPVSRTIADLAREFSESSLGGESRRSTPRTQGARDLFDLDARCKCNVDQLVKGGKLISLLYNEAFPRYPKESEQQVLLEEFGRLYLSQRSDRTVLDEFCYLHLQELGSGLGLQTKGMGAKDFVAAFRAICNAVSRPTKSNRGMSLATYKRANYTKWRLTDRERLPQEKLGIYRFTPRNDYFIPRQIQQAHPLWDRMAKAIGLSTKDYKEWQTRGTINTGKIFGYLSKLEGEIAFEFDYYLWNMRRINNRPNYGWCRNMVYSLIQQLIRQDPGYYMLYVLLRPDGWTRLISYPYYTKYALIGSHPAYRKQNFPTDSTEFRHIDLSMQDMLKSDRGINQIQGSVSLDDEHESHCTEVIPTMHLREKFQPWVESLQKRTYKENNKTVAVQSESYVNRITSRHWTAADARHFGTNWERVPCKKYDVRITFPHLPHGATGPGERTRRTVLPWYVAVQDDHQTLEITEGGDYDGVAKAHRDLASPPKTPSGLANKYAPIPYPFPAATQLSGLGALSDALVCRRKYTDPAVLHNFLELSEPGALQSWREAAVAKFKEAFNLLAQLDRRVFDTEYSTKATKPQPRDNVSYFSHVDILRKENPKATNAEIRDRIWARWLQDDVDRGVRGIDEGDETEENNMELAYSSDGEGEEDGGSVYSPSGR